MDKPNLAVISAVLLIMYFSLVSVAEILHLRQNPAVNILDPGLHAGDLQRVDMNDGEINDYRHPYYKSLKRWVMLDRHRVAETVEVIEAMLRDWEDLDAAEQAFCAGQLNRVIRSVNRLQFARILDAWSVSCNDMTLFPEALKKKPVFYRDLADRLVRTADEIKIRTNLLANFEIYWLENVNRAVGHLSQRQSSYRQWQNLRLMLKRGVRGYYRLAKNNGLQDERFFLLLKRIHLNILDRLLRLPGWTDSPVLTTEVKRAILDYLDDFHSPKDLGEVGKLFQREKLFDSQSLWVFNIRQQILFASSNYSKVIRDCEELLGEDNSCPSEEGQECIRLLLLLADAHIASHLLSSAIPVLGRAEELEPGRLDVGWRMFQVHRIIGVGEEMAATMNQRFQGISNSRVLEISSPVSRRTVFILDRQELELRVSHQLLSRMASPRMIQVMMDGRVVAEIALSELKNISTLSLPLECPRFSRHSVTVTVI